MLRCRDITELVGADALARAPLRDRSGVFLHLLMCRHCRAYVRSLRLLGETARRLAKVKALPSSERTRFWKPSSAVASRFSEESP